MADKLPVPADQCQADPACLKEYGSLHYIPNSGLNYASTGFFVLILIAQIFLGIRHKTWGFVSWLPSRDCLSVHLLPGLGATSDDGGYEMHSRSPIRP
jgi:hypothetical protein